MDNIQFCLLSRKKLNEVQWIIIMARFNIIFLRVRKVLPAHSYQIYGVYLLHKLKIYLNAYQFKSNFRYQIYLKWNKILT